MPGGIMKVTDACAAQGGRALFVCDFSPPRSTGTEVVERALTLDADFICVAYSPGRAVRVDSAMLAASIKDRGKGRSVGAFGGESAGKDVIFNLGTRDMNKLALQSHLLGAQLLGLENMLVLQGDPFSERDLTRVKNVNDFTPSGLVAAIAAMNQGVDFRGSSLRAPTDLCIGASIDLARGTEREATLTHAKAAAGAHFFLTQPVFSAGEIQDFRQAYLDVAGEELAQPVFYGLQVLVKDGVIFSNVPEAVRRDIEAGREGADVALETLEGFLQAGANRIYLVPPILRGGARDYDAAQRVLEAARAL